MFDPNENTAAAPASSAFADLMALLRLIGDDKVYQKRLDALMAATIKASDAKAAAAKQEAALAQKKTEQEAAFAKREAEISATAEEWADRKADVDNRQERLYRIQDNIVEQERQFKREILRYAGVTMNESMQDLPSWSQLARDVLGIRDVHYDNDTTTERGEVERLPDAPMVATIRRNKPPRPSRADH